MLRIILKCIQQNNKYYLKESRMLRICRSHFLIIFIFIFVLPIYAQKTIEGTIKDAQTGEPLSYANIQIVGTYRGTISNENGKYILQIKKLPAKVLVRYIGFISKETSITQKSSKQQDILLQPTVLEMEPIVVTAEDPAVSIMREVIRRKQIWRKKLLTYQAEAYTRLGLENDTSIVLISESTSDVFWDSEQGPREVIKSKRETENIKSLDILPGSVYLPNFYDDDVDIQGSMVIGPTHPDALKHYHFKLVGQRLMDHKIVFDINVEPKGKLQPTFIGRISVLDEVYGMIDVELKPSKAVIMPFPIKDWNVYHSQQFSDFDQDVWLPLDVRIGGDILISMPGIHFPRIKYNQLSRVTNYDVNVILPDSLYKKKRILSIDSVSIKSDTLLVARSGMIPLTEREEYAYETIDSTMTLEKAFQPTGFIAWLARLRIDTNENEAEKAKEVAPQENNKKKEGESTEKKKKSINLTKGMGGDFVFNRVDAFHLGLKYNRWIGKKLSINWRTGYKTGLKRWSGGGGFSIYPGKRRNTALSFRYLSNTDTRYNSDNYPIFYNTAANLFGFEDYFDYYWNKRFSAEMRHRFRKLRSRFTFGFYDEIHNSVEKNTDKDLVGRNYIQRLNPPIDEGRLRSFALKAEIGNEWVPWGIVGETGTTLKIEHSSPDILSSDFSFTKYEVAINWRLVSYLKRRLMPNVLDLRFVAGTFTGDLPVQRFGTLDVRSGAFSPFGVFRSLSLKPYEGEKYVALFWEHNFRTVPFEILGIDYLVKNGVGLVVHGASGRTWISEKRLNQLTFKPQYLDDYHHEVGFSINGIFGFTRFDVTKPINKSGIYIGFGIARIF